MSLGGVTVVTAQEIPRPAVEISRQASGESAYSFVKKLSSEEFSGRQTGAPGYTSATQWVAERFREWGVLPSGESYDYLQPFPSPYCQVHSGELAFLTGGESKLQSQPGSDFLPLLFSGSGRAETGLVFVGWGISAPELGYDDYAGVEVKGKMVLCFRGQPDPKERRFQPHDEHRARMEEAKRRGAVGLVYIYPEVISNPNGDFIPDFLPLMISEKAADPLLEEKSLTAKELRRRLEESRSPASFPLSSRIRYSVESTCFPDAVGYNVVGRLDGSVPELAGEPVVIGAHLDHTGRHLGILFPGADDNASGSATVMEVARLWSQLPVKPKRPVVFVLFGAEESGLIGSKHFAAHMPSRFKRVSGMFNLDMTGEGDGARAGYSAGRVDFKTVLDAANAQAGIVEHFGEIRQVGVRSSDFAPFFEMGAPVASIGSNGPHLAYHQSGDNIFRINPDIMAEIARFTFLAAAAWADR